MALKNIKYHLHCTSPKGVTTIGVLKTDQIELVETATAPTTNLSNGRIYLNSSENTLRIRVAGAWVAAKTTELT